MDCYQTILRYWSDFFEYFVSLAASYGLNERRRGLNGRRIVVFNDSLHPKGAATTP